MSDVKTLRILLSSFVTTKSLICSAQYVNIRAEKDTGWRLVPGVIMADIIQEFYT